MAQYVRSACTELPSRSINCQCPSSLLLRGSLSQLKVSDRANSQTRQAKRLLRNEKTDERCRGSVAAAQATEVLIFLISMLIFQII